MDQAWFEMADIRRRGLSNAVWIPLRASHQIQRIGKYGYVGFRDEFFGVGSIAVPVDKKADALQLEWSSVGISHNHAGYVDDDGTYFPSDVYESRGGSFSGLHLVLDQRAVGDEPSEWHLHQDFVTTLGLKREGDSWLRPEEDYIEVARLVRTASGSKARLEVRASHLRDYICARGNEYQGTIRTAWESLVLLAHGIEPTRTRGRGRVNREQLAEIDLHWHRSTARSSLSLAGRRPRSSGDSAPPRSR